MQGLFSRLLINLFVDLNQIYKISKPVIMTRKILAVLDVRLAIEKSNPPNIFIVAREVNTTGWSDGQLVPFTYTTPPDDGIYEFDFVAKPPSGIFGQMISPINSEYVWHNFPNDVKGIRIYASRNSISSDL